MKKKEENSLEYHQKVCIVKAVNAMLACKDTKHN